jgi:CHAD domain-containing protein
MEQTARRLIYLDWHVVRAYEAVLDNAPIELLHTLRIDCKRLRYAFEFTAEVLPPEVRRIIPEVVAMQDHLGALHDAIVAAHRLDRMMAEAGDAPEWAGGRAYRDALRARPNAWNARSIGQGT